MILYHASRQQKDRVRSGVCTAREERVVEVMSRAVHSLVSSSDVMFHHYQNIWH